MGRLTGTTTNYAFLTGRSFTTGYAYDKASNRTGFTDPEGGATAYVYDALNRVTTLTPPSAFTTGSFGFGYDALSRRTQMTRPNNVTTAYSYDNLSRLLSALHQLSGSTIDGATYTVDAAGNRTAKTDKLANVTSNYAYDAIYQLLGVTQGANTTESYTYDPVGNRLSSLGVSPYSYNTSNELTSTPSTTYTYDNNGNLLTKVVGSNTTTNAWDFENRLTSVTLPGSGGTVTFKYDPFGRRIYKSSSSGTSVYAYDGDNLIEETNATGTAVARYAQGLGLDDPLAMLRSSTTSYYHADGLGSVTSLSNTGGALAQTYTLDSFGNQTSSSGSLTNPFRFTGRELDTETNLYYFRARYVDQSTGRFLNEDPLSFDGGNNFYTYTRNSPINFKDPLGLAPDADCTDCKGKLTQGLEAGKKCCKDTDPLSGTVSPIPYSPCDTYMYINAGEMYRNGGNGNWGQLVRGCLLCMRSHGVSAHQAHTFCYWNSAKRVSTPWNLGLPAVGGLARAVGGAIATLPKQLLPIPTGGPFPMPLYLPCVATK